MTQLEFNSASVPVFRLMMCTASPHPLLFKLANIILTKHRAALLLDRVGISLLSSVILIQNVNADSLLQEIP